ncbi:arginine-tRNA-protein transferase [Lacibacter luteus]|uniref:Arginine-tRNA-protein transferase n=1 Tax=Lacibacter luteus TaxID=2508719 RepID=A0A4Q1CH31_9BACT|nr:arginine-tRNA-protein transferase [Lacibacter luteus]RXK59613.1 arginine-tRNA-protein transferase [Lacibacter luteus]
MIYYQHFYPASIDPALLDVYLSKGWYRIQQMLITTDLITKENDFLAVFWLRYRLADYQHSNKSRKLLKAIADFSITIEPLQITDELEQLFTCYRSAINFDMSETIQGYLLGDKTESVFATKMISIRHEGKLIAAGCYDEGETTTMGILNMYDPAYKKYSLGKTLVLLKLDEAIQQHKTYFYPGYVSLHTPKFDYKLFPDLNATELYHRLNDAWIAYNSVDLLQLHEEMLRSFFRAQSK